MPWFASRASYFLQEMPFLLWEKTERKPVVFGRRFLENKGSESVTSRERKTKQKTPTVFAPSDKISTFEQNQNLETVCHCEFDSPPVFKDFSNEISGNN